MINSKFLIQHRDWICALFRDASDRASAALRDRVTAPNGDRLHNS